MANRRDPAPPFVALASRHSSIHRDTLEAALDFLYRGYVAGDFMPDAVFDAYGLLLDEEAVMVEMHERQDRES